MSTLQLNCRPIMARERTLLIPPFVVLCLTSAILFRHIIQALCQTLRLKGMQGSMPLLCFLCKSRHCVKARTAESILVSSSTIQIRIQRVQPTKSQPPTQTGNITTSGPSLMIRGRIWFFEQMLTMRALYKKGYIGYTPQYVHTLSTKSKSIAILNDRVYDFTNYVAGGRTLRAPPGQSVPDNVDTNFMDQLVVDLFQQRSGQDVTKYWNVLQMGADEKARMQLCLDNLFFVGVTDTRNSAQCLFAQYILLAVSILMGQCHRLQILRCPAIWQPQPTRKS